MFDTCGTIRAYGGGVQAGDIAVTTSQTPVTDPNDSRRGLGWLPGGERVLVVGRSPTDSWYMSVIHPRFGPCQIFNGKLMPCKETRP